MTHLFVAELVLRCNYLLALQKKSSCYLCIQPSCLKAFMQRTDVNARSSYAKENRSSDSQLLFDLCVVELESDQARRKFETDWRATTIIPTEWRPVLMYLKSGNTTAKGKWSEEDGCFNKTVEKVQWLWLACLLCLMNVKTSFDPKLHETLFPYLHDHIHCSFL